MKLLLGVSGSISCYKAFDLTRELSKKGHEIKVVLTAGAEKFVRPELFKYLGALEVYSSTDDFNLEKYENNTSNVLHIDLANWADKFIMAPMSANLLSRLAQGQASDLLSSVFLAYPQDKPLMVFPAMNTKMLTNPLVQNNLGLLKKFSNIFIGGTQSGELACGEIGSGKLEDIFAIIDLIETFTLKSTSKTALITTGATISRLDEVRYLTNPSSGKTGYELAKVFLSEGYNVHVLAGKNSTENLKRLSSHPNYKVSYAVSTYDMKDLVETHLASADLYISSAAINDIAFEESGAKIKKDQLEGSLEIKTTPDILKFALDNKSKQFIVGFAAESDISSEVLKKKWISKPVDLLIGNNVSSGFANKVQEGFNSDDGEYFFFKEGKLAETLKLSKAQLGHEILKSYMDNNNDHLN